jgi:hypothetical protein
MVKVSRTLAYPTDMNNVMTKTKQQESAIVAFVDLNIFAPFIILMIEN